MGEISFSIQPPVRADNGQILAGSPVVNSRIVVQGTETIVQVGQLDGMAPQLISDIYTRLEPDSATGYVTYAMVAAEINNLIGTDWVGEDDIWKYSRAVHHDENTYPLEQAIRAHNFIQEITGDRPKNILAVITDLSNHELVVGGHENHEAMQARNIARTTMLYRGNPELRRYFFETTGSFLQRAYDQSTRYDSRKIYTRHLQSLGGTVSEPYIYDPGSAFFPNSLMSSKRLINQITMEALIGLRERPDLLALPSELDLMVATGYLHKMSQEATSGIINNLIAQSYDDTEPTRDECDLAEVYPPVYTMGRWFHWLTGSPMRPVGDSC